MLNSLRKKIFNEPLMISALILSILIVGGGLYLYTVQKKNGQQTESSAQTEAPKQERESESTNQPTIKDETADWKVYQNKKYGFSFSYPRDWQLSEKIGTEFEKQNTKLLHLISLEETSSKKVNTVTIFDNSENLLLKNWIELYNQNPNTSEQITVDKQVGLKYSKNAMGNNAEVIYVAYKEYIYNISLMSSDEINKIILNSFKFENENS